MNSFVVYFCSRIAPFKTVTLHESILSQLLLFLLKDFFEMQIVGPGYSGSYFPIINVSLLQCCRNHNSTKPI
jgi:hypothetical protein